jgi:hypothetical protein
MRSLERREELYPSRIRESEAESISLHFGDNFVLASIGPGESATSKLQEMIK